VPAQLRALRLKSENPAMPFQRDLARESEMQQSRISMFETPGAANITLDTISKIAAALKTGVIIRFVPFSEMLRWENSFSPDTFDVTRLDKDEAFLNPTSISSIENTRMLIGISRPVGNASASLRSANEGLQGTGATVNEFATAIGG